MAACSIIRVHTKRKHLLHETLCTTRCTTHGARHTVHDTWCTKLKLAKLKLFNSFRLKTLKIEGTDSRDFFSFKI